MLALSDKLTWYIARSSGLITWALVTATVVWGLAMSSRLIRTRGVPAWLNDLHRFLATLTVVFTAIHVVALMMDDYVDFGLVEVLVPGTASWRTGGVAWGIVAMWLLVAIQISSRYMRRLPRKAWRAVHMSSFPLFAFSTIHAIQTGADRANRLVQWMWLTGTTLVIGLLFFRLLHSRTPAAARRADITASEADDEAARLALAEFESRMAQTSPVTDRAASNASPHAESVPALVGSVPTSWASPGPRPDWTMSSSNASTPTSRPLPPPIVSA